MKKPMCFVLAGCAAFLGVLFFSCGAERPTMLVRVGAPPLEQNALLYVAAEKRFFARNGIDLQFRDFDSGPASLSAMESGQVEVAETAEFPFVESVMNGDPIRTIAANDRFVNDYVVALRSRGIARIRDLKGKRIGVTLRTITEFYLGRFLRLHGMDPKGVTIVDVQPSNFARSLRDGEVDALVMWQPYVSHITSGEPGSFEIWPVQSSQPVYGLLVCSSLWLRLHQSTVLSFLRSLSAAQHFLVRHPKKSETIVAKRLNYRDSYLSSVWHDHEFTLTLDFSLVAAMEDEARWVIANHLSRMAVVPDFMKFLDLSGLEAVRPDSVNTMR